MGRRRGTGMAVNASRWSAALALVRSALRATPHWTSAAALTRIARRPSANELAVVGSGGPKNAATTSVGSRRHSFASFRFRFVTAGRKRDLIRGKAALRPCARRATVTVRSFVSVREAVGSPTVAIASAERHVRTLASLRLAPAGPMRSLMTNGGALKLSIASFVEMETSAPLGVAAKRARSVALPATALGVSRRHVVRRYASSMAKPMSAVIALGLHEP